MAATRQTVRAAAGAEQPAVAARWWVIVLSRPVIANSREQLREIAAGARGRTRWETHVEAALDSQRLTTQVDAVLRRAGIDTWPLDGTQALSLLWERLHPAAELSEDEHEQLLEQFAGACQVAGATSPQEASEVRHRTLEAICEGSRVAIDIGEHPAWLRHRDGTLEETIHLATPPLATDPS